MHIVLKFWFDRACFLREKWVQPSVLVGESGVSWSVG